MMGEQLFIADDPRMVGGIFTADRDKVRFFSGINFVSFPFAAQAKKIVFPHALIGELNPA